MSTNGEREPKPVESKDKESKKLDSIIEQAGESGKKYEQYLDEAMNQALSDMDGKDKGRQR